MDLIAQMALFNNKHLFQIKLTKNKFYHLEQIARLKFYLESLLDEIALISKKRTKQEIFNTIQNMLYIFDKSILCFNKPDLSTLFPEKLTENNIITPSLPNDLIIQFYIKGEYIKIDFINYLPVIPSRKGKKKTVIINQREYEINDYLNLTISHPGLSYLLKFLEKARLELLTFISHLESF
ncbi:hypothetical protein K502DRAFT_325081 [Neoconidiobolus thromboides FSU 785]|nr:hypothetical protein K502DRAFT_325081 [Neoconidiobolus thromboides FSU 785]